MKIFNFEEHLFHMVLLRLFPFFKCKQEEEEEKKKAQSWA